MSAASVVDPTGELLWELVRVTSLFKTDHFFPVPHTRCTGEQVMLDETSNWYHGTRSVLKVGDVILPASVSGVQGVSINFHYPAKKHLVYMTPNLHTAIVYSVGIREHHHLGYVYRVKPKRFIAPDIEDRNNQFCTAGAEIIEDVTFMPVRWSDFFDSSCVEGQTISGLETVRDIQQTLLSQLPNKAHEATQ
jgi:hypothetical protein